MLAKKPLATNLKSENVLASVVNENFPEVICKKFSKSE